MPPKKTAATTKKAPATKSASRAGKATAGAKAPSEKRVVVASATKKEPVAKTAPCENERQQGRGRQDASGQGRHTRTKVVDSAPGGGREHLAGK